MNVPLSSLDPKVAHNAVGGLVQFYAQLIEDYEKRLLFVQSNSTGLGNHIKDLEKKNQELEKRVRELEAELAAVSM